jgi:putative hemolysin
VRLLTGSSNLILKPFGDRTNFSEALYSADELQQLVEDAKKSGSLHPQAAEIASRAFDFVELTALEVMVPRREVVMLSRDATMAEVQEVVTKHPYTRMPVHDENADDLIGYINVKDLALLGWRGASPKLDEVMRPAHFVPDSKRAVDLLKEMQEQHVPMSIVLNEQGGLVGIITIEDLIEELVGEIFSDYKRVVAEPFTAQPDGTWVALGTAPIRDLNRSLGLELPDDGDWKTVAGLFIGLAGRIPVKGDRQQLPSGVVMEVMDASPRRIRSVRLHPAPPTGPVAQPR